MHAAFQRDILPRFSRQVAFEFHDFPLVQHHWAFDAAVIARWLDGVHAGLGFAWRDYCFRQQSAITPDNFLSKAEGWTRRHGLPPTAVALALSDPRYIAEVRADQALGGQYHVWHTPSIFFRGSEVQSLAALEPLLDRAVSGVGP